MIDVEFLPKTSLEQDVLSAWKLYHAHLQDKNYPLESWAPRKADLLIDLLHVMGKALGYPFDKAHIKNSSYYPLGYGETVILAIPLALMILPLLQDMMTQGIY